MIASNNLGTERSVYETTQDTLIGLQKMPTAILGHGA